MRFLNAPNHYKISIIIPALREEIALSPDPLTGTRAYRDCGFTEATCGCYYHTRSHQLNNVIRWFEERLGMARSKKSKGTPQWKTEFVRIELKAEDKKRIDAFIAKPPLSFDSMLAEILQLNYKCSFSFSEHNDSFIFSITGREEDCDNPNKCMTSHAKDPVKAAWVGMYKFYVLCEKGVWESDSDEEDFG